ncbi:MAG: RidA family protein [Firmicutes bacterium]|nr:RidA family protein [Bacillota bacterium]
MHKKAINGVAGAPSAVGPYSQAVRSGQFLFASGQVGLDPATGNLVDGDVKTQARQAMENVGAVLKSQGLGFEHIVKALVFLVDIADFGAFNEVYGSYFKGDPPARSCVAVAALPKNARVEIEVIATYPS